jgi:hypothetical protein
MAAYSSMNSDHTQCRWPCSREKPRWSALQLSRQLPAGLAGVAGDPVLFSSFGILLNNLLFPMTDICITAGGGLHRRGPTGQQYSCPGSCPAELAGHGGHPGLIQPVGHAAQLFALPVHHVQFGPHHYHCGHAQGRPYCLELQVSACLQADAVIISLCSHPGCMRSALRYAVPRKYPHSCEPWTIRSDCSFSRLLAAAITPWR